MANTHRTLEQWQKIFKQYASSNLQIAAFCKKQKLNTSSFYAWRKRLADMSLSTTTTDNDHKIDDNQPAWVSITPEQMTPSSCWDIELALPNGVVLRMMNN
jgi:hypothetical protein